MDSRLPRVEHWEEPNRKGVVAYLDAAEHPRGFLLWNTWDSVDTARGLIRGGQPIDAKQLAARFP